MATRRRDWFKQIETREPSTLRKAAERFVTDKQVAGWIADEQRGPFATESGTAALPPEISARVAELRQLIEKEEATASSKTFTVMAVEDGKPVEQPILLRGNHLAPGKPQPRHFLRVIEGGGVTVPADRSGRLEMARWIAHADNPLTAHVIVNRVWHWHFGRGSSPRQTTSGSGRGAHTSATARLAGETVHRVRVVDQIAASADL